MTPLSFCGLQLSCWFRFRDIICIGIVSLRCAKAILKCLIAREVQSHSCEWLKHTSENRVTSSTVWGYPSYRMGVPLLPYGGTPPTVWGYPSYRNLGPIVLYLLIFLRPTAYFWPRRSPAGSEPNKVVEFSSHLTDRVPTICIFCVFSSGRNIRGLYDLHG